ncbi:MAG: phosphoglycerate kinase [Candidatus Komeilibacteria bacterium]
MKSVKQLSKLKGKTVLVRVDFNVTVSAGKVVDDFKMQAALPTIQYLRRQGARVILVSHFGRPLGKDNKFSLRPIARHLSQLLQTKVEFTVDYKKVSDSKAQLILLENIRFDKREQAGSKALAKELADLADVYVNEAFAVSHRKDTSVYYLPNYLPSYAGLRLLQEVHELSTWHKPSPGSVAVLGGAKISTKLKLVKVLAKKMDYVLLGGGLANNYLQAIDLPIGQSLVEPGMKTAVRKDLGANILGPIDVVVQTDKGKRVIKPAADVQKTDKIYDIGPISIDIYKDIIKQAKQVLWNGPMGLFEIKGFQSGTYEIAMAVANSKRSLAGGGETVTAINNLQLASYYTFISTGGGAMLKYLEVGSLPALAKL